MLFRSTKAINILLAIAVVIVSVYLVFQTQSVNPASSANSEIEVPNTVAVGKGTVRQTVIAPGQIEFVDTTLLVPKVGGQIAAIRVRPGDFVRQGDILAQLDGGPFEAALKAAQAARQRAEANHDREIFRAELALRMARLRLQMATEKDQDQNAEAGLDIQLLELGVEDAQAYLDGLIESGIDPGKIGRAHV